MRSALVLLPFWASITTLVCWVFSYNHPLDADGAPQAQYQAALFNYWLALMLEGLVEPLFILGTYHFNTRQARVLEVVSEVCGRVAASSIFAASVLIPQMHAPAAVAYSRGQLAYAITMALFYFVHAAWHSQEILQWWTSSGSARHKRQDSETSRQETRSGIAVKALADMFGAPRPVVSKSLVFGWQAVQKMVLQDASRFVLAGLSAHVAGVYGEVQNLGSLVVRIVFWPIESAAFRTFSRFGGDSSVSAAASSSTSSSPASQGLLLLSVLNRLVVLVALLACTFGPNYAFSAIHILLSSTWSSTEAPQVLAAYCVYLLFMAVNGVTEAYVHATMNTAELKRANVFMVFATACHVGLLWLSTSLGENCILLVVADCANMALRIAFSTWCIVRKHPSRERPAFGAWLPSIRTFLLLSACFAFTAFSNQRMLKGLGHDSQAFSRLPAIMAEHIGVGCVVLVCCLCGLLWAEAALIRDVRKLLKPHAE